MVQSIIDTVDDVHELLPWVRGGNDCGNDPRSFALDFTWAHVADSVEKVYRELILES